MPSHTEMFYPIELQLILFNTTNKIGLCAAGEESSISISPTSTGTQRAALFPKYDVHIQPDCIFIYVSGEMYLL